MTQTRAQTRGEEIANWTSHSIGLAAAIAAFPVLVVATVRHGSTLNIVAASVYASTMVLMFAASMIYHMLTPGRAKEILRKIDHAAIYLLIAGTYTPFTFSVLAGPWGWSLFGVIWGLAALGLFLKFSNRLQREWLSSALYLLMGWLVVVAAVPLFRNLSLTGSVWLIAGGLAYTGGIVFYLLDSRLRYGHFIWHLFVLAGAACHFFAVLLGCTPSIA
ncbi:hemolysin III family protein [Uliginosibacterium paludis]|uniref:Hemolysin III family protein n=1 Tax=Uliginosibacterium paludis TaxID=1615952 RepID=A0ABV2CQ00_9RHOO